MILSVDPSLGRVDCSLMSDQTLMEMLIDGFDDKTQKKYQEYDETYINVCIWPCITCDEDERVIEINMDSINIIGSIQLCYVPPSVKDLKIRNRWRPGKLSGSIDLSQLPEGMQLLDLQHNQLTGEIDLTQLPNGMEFLSLFDNHLAGKVDLAHLPYKIQYLFLENNKLTGDIDLTKLPDGIQLLKLGNNQLTGEIDLTQLPDRMEKLHLSNNQLTREINLSKLPKSMHELHLNNNQLTGKVDLNKLPKYMRKLHLENNQLSGSFVIKSLPPVLHINVQENKFNAVAVVDSKTRARIMLRGSGVSSVVDENGGEIYMKRFL